MARHTLRTALLLLRDARGRFLRLRTPLPATPRRRPCRRRPVVAAVQLALF